MDPVLLSDDMTADTVKNFLADTNQEEFASTGEMNFRIQKILVNTGGEEKLGAIPGCMIGTLRFKIREKMIPWSVKPEMQYSAWVLVKINVG